jgi:molecular chaperone DnaJ
VPQVKDLYKVLGVARDETLGNIRKAFRRLAKEHHPDRAGAEGEDRFRELAQAHEVLTDPESRRCHDAQLRCTEDGRPAGRRRGPPPRPSPRPGPRPWQPGELIRDVAYAPPGGREPGPTWPTEEAELVLSPARAWAGGPVRLAVGRPCPACRGLAPSPLFDCPECGGRGVVERGAAFVLDLPPGLRDGELLDLVGGEGTSLRLRVTVRDGPDRG